MARSSAPATANNALTRLSTGLSSIRAGSIITAPSGAKIQIGPLLINSSNRPTAGPKVR